MKRSKKFFILFMVFILGSSLLAAILYLKPVTLAEEGGRPEPPLRGVTCSLRQATGSYNPANAYDDEDYQRIKGWKMNTVVFHGWWGDIEPKEEEPGIYDDVDTEERISYITRIKEQVELAKDKGLYPIIAIMVTYGWPKYDYHPDGGWPSDYGYHYVNFDDLPYPNDPSGMSGRERLIDLWEYLATEFPDTGLCLTWFPYHREKT